MNCISKQQKFYIIFNDYDLIFKIIIYRDNNVEIEKSIAETTKKIVKTEAVHNSLLNTIEVLKHKNNVINKRFKSEFPSKLIYEQALIAYK